MVGNTGKKLISALMALAMVFTLLPVAAFAESEHVCGKEEHTHGGGCYEEVVVCRLQEVAGHSHGDGCYTPGEPVLSCESEEADHVHGDGCYTEGEPVLTCAQDAFEGHSHGDECRKSLLSCTAEEHEHDESCVAAEERLPAGGANLATEAITVQEYHFMDRDAFRTYCLEKAGISKASALTIWSIQFVGTVDGTEVTTTSSCRSDSYHDMYSKYALISGTHNQFMQPDQIDTIKVEISYLDQGVQFATITFDKSDFTFGDPADPAVGLNFIEVFSQREEQKCTVTLDYGYDANLEDEDEENTIDVIRVNHGETVEAVVATRDGYDFLGWFDSSGKAFDFNTAITENITLTARWEENVPQGETVTLVIAYSHENQGGGNDDGHDGPATQAELEAVIAGAQKRLGDQYATTIAKAEIAAQASDGKGGTVSTITLTIYEAALDEGRKFDLEETGFAPETLTDGCKLAGGSTTATFGGNTVEQAVKLLYKGKGTPPVGEKGDTVVTVWYYYGENAMPVAGAAVAAQARDSKLITEEWVTGLKSMDFYNGDDKDCFSYSEFEIYPIADGATGWPGEPFYALEGPLDLTDIKEVRVHIAYDKRATPIIYHSNFELDTTHRVLAEKNGNAYTYTALSYEGNEGTGLPAREGHTFKGWSLTSGGEATILAGSVQTATEAGLELFAVWESNEPDVVTVSYVFTGRVPGGATVPAGGTYEPDAEVTLDTATASTGRYTFHGWVLPEGLTLSGGKFIMPESNVTITGNWTYSTPGGNDNDNDNDDNDNGRPTVTPPVEDEEIILPEDVPLGDAPAADKPADREGDVPATLPGDGEDFVIADEDVPLGNLPQTGTVAKAVEPAWTLGLLALAASLAAAGLSVTIFRKRAEG